MAKLVLTKSGQTAGEFYITRDTTLIGRDGMNHICLDHPEVSRFHAEIHRNGLCYTLTDRRSTNGTRHNGSFLRDASTLLGDQDAIAIGDSILTFHLDALDQPHLLTTDSFAAGATLQSSAPSFTPPPTTC